MAAFGSDGRCLMRALQEELDDPDAARLRPLLGLHRAALRPGAGPALVELAGRHLRSRPVELEVKKMAPDADGRDAQDPRRRPDRARLGAGALRRRRLVAGGRARPEHR